MNNRSKILLGVILFLVVTLSAILVKGANHPVSEITVTDANTAGANNALVNQASFQDLKAADPVEPSTVLTETVTSEPVAAVTYSNLSFDLKDTGLELNGILVFNNAPVEVLAVDLYCDGKFYRTVNSKLDGTFKHGNVCYPNQEAYVLVKYNGEVVQSETMIVPHGNLGHRIYSLTSTPAGVPEFSALTLGLAVVTVLFGLVLLRKR